MLFVEDDPTLRMLTGEVMLELGHQVTLSETAEDALAQLEGGEFDVLLTDVGLHGMSGIELARRVRQHHPGVTVVIASGYAVDAREEALADVRTMLKPYDIQQVRALLEAIARERRADRADQNFANSPCAANGPSLEWRPLPGRQASVRPGNGKTTKSFTPCLTASSAGCNP